MKRIISFVLAVCLMFVAVSIVNATPDDSTNVFYYGDKEIIVESDELSYDEMKAIADFVADESIESSDDVTMYGLMCSLFGHSIKTSYVTEITHNVYTTSPKCVEKQYRVESCSRSGCDHIEKYLESTTRIPTCHG